MNDDIKKFKDAIKPYLHLWKSMEFTCFCVKFHNRWVNLVTKILLTDSPIRKAPKVDIPISLPEFRVITAKFGTKNLSRLVNDLSNGSIRLGRNKIIFKGGKGTGLDQNYSLHFTRYGRQHTWYWFVIDDFKFILDGEASSSQTILEHDLKEKIEAKLGEIDPPYNGISDVAKKFLGDRRPIENVNRPKFTFLAPISIRFSDSTDLLEDRLIFEINSCFGIKKSNLTIGIIRRFFDEHDERNIIKGNVHKWKKEGKRQLFLYEENLKNCSSATLLLTYKGTQLDRKELFSPIFSSENPRLIVHDYFDSNFELLKKYLGAKGKNKAPNFESAVKWLLHACGFCIIHYGREEGIKEEIDLIAFVPRSNIILAGECTIKEPDLKGKLSSLIRKVDELRELLPGFGILPVMFTPLRTEVPKSDMEKAGKNGIAIVKGKDLDNLFNMAVKQEPTSKIINSLESLMPYTENVYRLSWRQPLGHL